MYQVHDEPIETIHLYVVREGEKRPSLIPVIIAIFALSILIAIGVLTPYKQPEQRASLRVPAVPLFVKTYSAAIQIVPTGVKTYPATVAHGTLTMRNGSIIGQTIPTGFVVVSSSGVQVATDVVVYVPGADAAGDGMALVAAHVVAAGVNVPALAINAVIGTSLFIRNLRPFTGGHPGYSVKFATHQDTVRAIDQARAAVTSQVMGLHYPCRETITNTLVWHCQFVTYSVPSYMHVLSAQLHGNEVLVTVWFITHPRRIWVK
jgi:hypothetical protein